jgi:hypothetical protein
MANIGQCVVITAEILVEATNKLKELGHNDLAKKLIANHKPLKPIVKDAFHAELTHAMFFDDYLTETEI